MKFVICEKPKVAEKIANAISKRKAEKKNCGGVWYYEAERDGEKIVVVSAVGHIYTLRQKKGEKGYPIYNVEWAPSYEVDPDASYTKSYLKAIEKLAPGADEYICACDYDVEGSLIGYNVLRFACNTEQGSRMKFSALTREELEEAYAKRGPLDIENALAGEARHMLDWFYGINLSRALMASIRSAGASREHVMSIGRVQGPCLAILAKREKEIASFVPTPYWEVSCKAKGVVFFHEHGRFDKKEEADRALSESKPNATVAKISSKSFEQPPNPPFDLTSLQIEAHRALGISPAKTLEYAQSLYEASMISYPRTSSQKLPSSLNLKKVLEALSKTKDYGDFAKAIISKGRLLPIQGKKEDPAHPAIHPTGLYADVGESELKLYDLIVRRFLACFEEPAIRETQKIVLGCGKEKYVASGTRTVKPGWFLVYEKYLKKEEANLPPFYEGEKVEAKDFKAEKKMTQPPKRYTPASIIAELERRGLGTKATRAVILETLFKRKYIEGESIRVTPFGMSLYELLSKIAPEIMDEELTRKIEEDMEKIKDGGNEKKVVEKGIAALDAIIKKFGSNEKEIGFELLTGLKKQDFASSLLGKCPKCQGDMRIIKSKAGKQFAGCINYPDCKCAFPLPQQAKISPLGRACEKCGAPVVKVVRKAKKPFEMCIDPDCETKKKSWNAKNN